MKVGDYVKYKYENCVYIGKIKFISEVMSGLDETLQLDIDNCMEEILKEEIIKSSPNIIDLIEVGDYVNGLPVERIGRTLDDENDIRVWFGVATYGRTILNQINHRYTVKDEFEDDYSLKFRCIKPEDIKSIVTKEQFSSMEYKVGVLDER